MGPKPSKEKPNCEEGKHVNPGNEIACYASNCKRGSDGEEKIICTGEDGCAKKKLKKWYCRLCYNTEIMKAADEGDDDQYLPDEEDRIPTEFAHAGIKANYQDDNRDVLVGYKVIGPARL